MTEPMTDERLAEIRAEIENDSYGHSYDGGRAARELLAEVDRMRALAVPTAFTMPAADAFTPEQIAKWQAAWDELCAGRVVMYDLPAPPPSGPMWEPLRDQPRSHDYPTGG